MAKCLLLALSQEDVVGQEIMVMLDANARVGSVTSAATGPAGPEEQNDNGNRFQLNFGLKRTELIIFTARGRGARGHGGSYWTGRGW